MMPDTQKALEEYRRWSVIGIVSALLLSVMIVLGVYFITARQIRTDLLNPPVVLLDSEGEIRENITYPALDDSVLCAGGEVRWMAHVRALKDADSNIWRSLKSGRPGDGVIVRDPFNAQVISVDRSSFEQGNTTQRPISYPLPTFLEPGNYYILNSIQNGTGRPVRYYVPFVVTEECEM